MRPLWRTPAGCIRTKLVACCNQRAGILEALRTRSLFHSSHRALATQRARAPPRMCPTNPKGIVPIAQWLRRFGRYLGFPAPCPRNPKVGCVGLPAAWSSPHELRLGTPLQTMGEQGTPAFEPHRDHRKPVWGWGGGRQGGKVSYRPRQWISKMGYSRIFVGEK